jgi:hypothetical protein
MIRKFRRLTFKNKSHDARAISASGYKHLGSIPFNRIYADVRGEAYNDVRSVLAYAIRESNIGKRISRIVSAGAIKSFECYHHCILAVPFTFGLCPHAQTPARSIEREISWRGRRDSKFKGNALKRAESAES